jgi:hypothetical protein
MSWGSSVSIVFDYRLDDRGSIPQPRQNILPSSLCVKTSPKAHTASCPIGAGDPSPGVKHSQGVTLTTHSHIVPRSRKSTSYISSPLSRLHGVAGQRYFLLF